MVQWFIEILVTSYLCEMLMRKINHQLSNLVKLQLEIDKRQCEDTISPLSNVVAVTGKRTLDSGGKVESVKKKCNGSVRCRGRLSVFRTQLGY